VPKTGRKNLVDSGRWAKCLTKAASMKMDGAQGGEWRSDGKAVKEQTCGGGQGREVDRFGS